MPSGVRCNKPEHKEAGRDARGKCTICKLEYGRRWYRANKKKVQAWNKRWRSSTRPRRKGQPEPSRACPAICEWPGCARKATDLDHCHISGKFRGWLCRRHNIGLGLLGDTLDEVRAGIVYLTTAQ